jgi:lipoprotein-anchoring transpeptidase ErfK/SrfK
MSRGVGVAPAQGDRRHRALSFALALAIALVGSAGLTTAVRGPAAGTPLAGREAAGPPPAPAVISFLAGAVSPGTGAESAGPSPGAGAAAPVDPASPINPTTPVSVAVEHGRLSDVTMTDTGTGRPVPGALSADGHSWQTSAALSYSDTYQIAAGAIGVDNAVARRTATVSTLHPASLTSAAFRSFGDTAVGVGQPVVVRFSHPVADRAAAERGLSVTSDPPQPGGWFRMSNSEAHYRPPTYWQPGTTIALAANLFGVDLGKGAFGKVDATATLHIHDSWVAKADGRSETMRIFHNGGLVTTMPISLGSADHPSHNGPHVISDRQPSIVMDSCTYGVCQGDPGYYKEKVDLDERISNDGEFVHSAPWSVGQQGLSNVSHGCVNLSPANARWFFGHFAIGDVVEIARSGGPALPVWDTYGDWGLPWAQWQAGGAT